MTIDQSGRAKKRNYILLTVTIFACFLIFGFSENIKGPAIPRIQTEFGLSEARLGLLLALNSLAYLTACFFTASLSRKIGLKAALAICLAGMALSGCGICFAPNYAVLTVSYFIMYLGNGMLEITLGLMAAAIFTKNTGTMMNLSHFFYGLSSCVAPFLSAALIKARFGQLTLGWRYMYLLVLSWSLLPIIPVLMGRFGRPKGQEKAGGHRAFLKDPSTLPIILILSLGVTCEMGAGGWLVNFLEKSRGMDSDSAALTLTGFFICFTLARLLLGPLTDKIGYVRSLMIFTLFSGLVTVAGVLCGRPGTFMLMAAGFGIAPLYPTVMALLAKLFSGNIDSAMTVTLTIMGVTIVASNLLLGFVIDAVKALLSRSMGAASVGPAYATGYIFLGLCSIGAFFASLSLYRRLKRAGRLV